MAVSILKPPNGSFRIETTKKIIGYIFNGHSPTDESVRSGVRVM